jgi:hypothetical protein
MKPDSPARWHVPIVPATQKLRQDDCLKPVFQSQPEQHSETFLLKTHTQKKSQSCQMWWCMPVVIALGRLRQEVRRIMSSGPAWAMYWDAISKKGNNTPLCDLAVTLLDMYQRKIKACVQTETCIQAFIEVVHNGPPRATNHLWTDKHTVGCCQYNSI